MRARRAAVSIAEAEQAGRAAARWIQASEAFAVAPTLALYAAIPGEVGTRALFEAGKAAGKRICLPRFTSQFRLEFAKLEDWDQLEPGAHAVPEPPRRAVACELSARDLVIVPGVAFDAAGRRLGRGAGYYDRGFPADAEAAPILFGLGFSFQVVARVPSGCHDRRMDAVCTEEGLQPAGSDEEEQ